jgi:uncharacterized repeat protein (TIGR03803 family)
MKYSLLFLFFLFQIFISQAQSSIWGVTSSGGGNGAGVIFKMDGSGNNLNLEYDLTRYDGDYPKADLVKGPDGKLYGMTSSCCTFNGAGVLFQYDPATSTYTRKHYFDDTLTGLNPYGSLLLAADGMFYGMACRGGIYKNGVLFQYNPTTSTYTKKIDFDGSGNGSLPYGSLIQTPDGKMYGMTSTGGANDYGVIFEYNPSTSTLIKKFDFDGTTTGGTSHGSLVRAIDGMFYGMAGNGGASDLGVLFKFDPANDSYTKILEFNDTTNGSNPYGSLLQAADGYLYGVTSAGGAHKNGVLFQFNPSTTSLTVKFDFDSAHGANPYGSLIQATDGNLYGMTSFGGANDAGVIFQYNPLASSCTKKFDFSTATGANPNGSLMQNADGMLYGMTYDFGAEGVGSLFQFNPTTSVFNKRFDFLQATNGSFPSGSLLATADGMIYGTTRNGGMYESGVIFQYDPKTFTYTKKFDFNDSVTGSYPTGYLVQAKDGMLYGLTIYGGTNDGGTLFQYDPLTSTCSKKYDFADSNISNPFGSLILAKDGMLYGLTREGGANNMGALFQYNSATHTLSKKIDFDDVTNGKYPDGSLIQAADGKLYGTTRKGGTYDAGTLFQYDLSNATLVKKFDFDTLLGMYPEGALVETTDGMLYGMTSSGGTHTGFIYPDGAGTIYQFDPSNSTPVKKYDFDGSLNGARPNGSLLRASDNNLYGVTLLGGVKNMGVVFQFNPATLSYVKKYDFDRKHGENPDYVTLSEIIVASSISDMNAPVINIDVYPNPSSGPLTVMLGRKVNHATVKLLTVAGQIVLEKRNFLGDRFNLNISEYKNGLYILEIIENGHSSKVKIVKE